jgi:hypothetical protein
MQQHDEYAIDDEDLGGNFVDPKEDEVLKNRLQSTILKATDLNEINLSNDEKMKKLEQYFVSSSDDDSDDDSMFDDEDKSDEDEDNGVTIGTEDNQTANLIDVDLVNLLKYCKQLKKKHYSTEEYKEEVLLKEVTLGKTDKKKTIIFDMDETLISA